VCPYHANSAIKDAFFKGGKSSYTQEVDDALNGIDRLPGRHLYFLDDFICSVKKRFAQSLFDGMQGMKEIFREPQQSTRFIMGRLDRVGSRSWLADVFL